MSVPRFDPSPHQMTPSSEGAYVRYEDYAKLEKALEQAISVGCLCLDSDLNMIATGDGDLRDGVEFPDLAAYLREREDSDEE